MAKKSIMALVVLLLAVVSVSILFFSPCGITIEKFQNAPEPIPPFCFRFGYPSPDNALRFYTENECVNILNGNWVPGGECTRKEGGSYSYECRELNNEPMPVPVKGGVQPIKSMTPPPSAAPTPVSAAALTLTPAQCSSLCPVTQESCESKFSCKTRLEPIGTAPAVITKTV